MTKELSVLIPTYNDPCASLVADLHRQAEALGIGYEILVADDGSTLPAVVEANRAINQLSHCRYIERPRNSGRAAIRNFLVGQARHEWLLFIDSDMVVCRDDYLRRYAETDAPVAYGGLVIGNVRRGNLRSLYEKASEHVYTVERRRQAPYQDFHTANFMARRDIMLANPFDERFRHYGYEDVLFGKALQRQGVAICHIDNPLSFEIYESNADFVSKTEEGLRTLWQFRDELRGYSRLLAVSGRLPHWPLRLCHRLLGPWERANLTGSSPSLLVFRLYKIGYYLCLETQTP